jgi:hypothetical protein
VIVGARRLLTGLMLLVLSLPTIAQQPDIGVMLNSEDRKQLAKQLTDLGVEDEIARPKASPHDEYLQIGWLPLRVEQGTKYAALFLPCGDDSDSAYLYLMKGIDEKWHAIDRGAFDCHYDDSVSVATASLRKQNLDEVLVHHAGSGHGTGLSEQHFQVFSVRDGKFKQLLDTEEVVVASGYPQGSREFTQHSIFVLIPQDSSGPQTLEETRSTTLNGKLTVKRRRFRWSPERNRLVPTEFADVRVP